MLCSGMIETIDDCKKFFADVDSSPDGEYIFHFIPVENLIHSADISPCILFIRNVSLEKTYYYSFGHPDSKPKIHCRIFLKYIKRRLKNNIKWAIDAKSFNQMLSIFKVKDANLCGFFKDNEILDINDYDTVAHSLIRRNNGNNRTIPLLKHKESFDNMCVDIEKMVRRFKIDDSFNNFNDIILTSLGKIESNGIYVDKSIFEKHFGISPNKNSLVFSQYNVYTSTGRPSNRFGGINYAAMNHTDGSRSALISRYGEDGRMVVVDYTAFHPRIICYLTKYNIPNDKDIYEYLAKLYFNKKEVDDTDIANSKKLTFRQLYGGVEDKYLHIKYLSNLKSYINEQWEFFNNNGYILTPFFKRKITNKHIKEPSPEKVFNYILQAVEGEIAISRIQLVLKFLFGKKTKAVLYTYDAVLYDFHKDDGYDTLNEIRKIMSFDGIFPMKTYIGESYNDVKLVNI